MLHDASLKKIALFGAGGTIGRRIAAEALRRGHRVTAVVRDPTRFAKPADTLDVVKGDILDPASVAAAVRGQDAVISAVGPAHTGDVRPQKVAPGVQLVDTPGFPAAWRPVALAHRDALTVYRATPAAPTGLDWTYFSPAALIEPGERTGTYRIGTDQLLTDVRGGSRISAEDFAVAVLDELERGAHPRQRITVAY
ncbi:MAG: 3-beta hydroxysteroid dehydrogenase [Gemmatimonadetes bacterium]|nr:MAG: 3-beta hydroxysteroid dehydrogenase [Gemmatimonadota bacterium]